MANDTDHIFPGKPFIETTLDALHAKDDMSRKATIPYLQRAAMAGIIIGVFYGAYYTTVSVFSGLSLSGTSLAGALRARSRRIASAREPYPRPPGSEG